MIFMSDREREREREGTHPWQSAWQTKEGQYFSTFAANVVLFEVRGCNNNSKFRSACVI